LSYAVYVLLVLLALIGSARWLNQRSRRRNAELEQLVQDRTKALEVAMEQLSDETRNAATLAERSRLAGEIHDSLQQGLSGSLLHLETTLTHPALVPELRAKLHVMHNMLSYSREEVQHAVWNLSSPLLQKSTLDQALRALAEYINAAPATINVVIPAGSVSLPAEVQHNLLRIAQEAITNAVKHAHAGHIGVTLQVDDHAVILSVTDDGRGFDVAACRGIEGHFGLRGIEARVHSIQAELQIASAPGAGTTIQVHVPRGPAAAGGAAAPV
jgi:signal transduction histidine kinase